MAVKWWGDRTISHGHDGTDPAGVAVAAERDHKARVRAIAERVTAEHRELLDRLA